MVAIVTGAGLGLERSSGFVLGSGGQVGDSTFNRYGENVSVNAANGNLVVTRTDEILIGQGQDDVMSRNYNSLGPLSIDNGDNWQFNVQRRITGLTGTINTAGSTVTRIGEDGSDIVYTYDTASSAYVAKQGAGAYDTLSWNGTIWTWNDGSSTIVETYDSLANSGKILTSKDGTGRGLTFSYLGSYLDKVTTTTTTGTEYTQFVWSSNNIARIVTYLSDGTILTRVHYTYDSLNRLSAVTTDLSPNDSSTSDGAQVATTYTYVSNTAGDPKRNLIAAISQTGGANLAITYDTSNRVQSLVESMSATVTRTTNFSYDTTNRVTTVTEGAGKPEARVSKLAYDTSGELTGLTLASGQSIQEVFAYTYDGNGNVLTATDAAGNTTTYGYDTHGNRILDRDAMGNTITRTFDAATNLLLSETQYVTPDPDGAGSGQPGQPMTTRYAYDSAGRLRFTVSAAGEVTQNFYNGAGTVSGVVVYRDATYTTSGTISESGMTSWVAGLTNKNTAQEMETIYDFRGNAATISTFNAMDANGNPTGIQTTLTYQIDQSGDTISSHTSGPDVQATYTYDGLWRVTSSVINGATTSIAFSDASNRSVTAASATGLSETANYDLDGDLVSDAISATGLATATVSNGYDNLGRLLMTTDANGNRSYIVYDALNRRIADIAADGAMTEYGYDASNNLVKTIGYVTRISGAALASLVDANGNPVTVTNLVTIRPAANAGDDWTWNVYDDANRLIETIDGNGDATLLAYDGMSNLISRTSYTNVMSSTQIAGFKTTTPVSAQVPSSGSTGIVTRDFYDNDGRLMGSLDGDGFLTRTIYDAAGRATETDAYATAANGSLWATGTFSQLLTSVGTSSADKHDRYVYGVDGLLHYTLNAMLVPTAYVYDSAGNILHTIQYDTAIAPASYSYADVTTAVTAIAGDANNRTSWSVYDSYGRIAYSIDAGGAVTGYVYDAAGRLIKQTAFSTLRSTTSDPSLSVMTSWATTNASANDHVSRMYYDPAGRLVYTVDADGVVGTGGIVAADGYVTESRYDTGGRKILDIRYAEQHAVTDSDTLATIKAALGSTIPTSAVQTSYQYDADNNLTDQVDAVGSTASSTTHLQFNGQGLETDRTTAYGTANAETTHYTYDSVGRVLSETDPIDSSNSAVTSYAYDALGNVATATDARGNTSYSYYDGLNRLVLQVDAQGYATKTSYTIDNQVASVTHYAIPVSATAGTPPTLSTSSSDATTTFTYDTAGHLTATKDAEGHSEQYQVDVFGDRIKLTNKLGGSTTYTYDKRGLELSETATTMTVSDSNGGTVATGVTDNYQYDSWGNLTKTVEAAGLGDVRTTTYAYDRLNLQVSSQGDAVAVINSSLAASTVLPTKYVYDSRGNVIETTDPTGAQTFFYYDSGDNKIASLSANGILSTWTYDANDNVTAEKAYAATFALPSTPGGTPPAPGAAAYRQTLYTYDRSNRLLTTTVSSPSATAATAIWDGQYNLAGTSYAAAQVSITITNAYDKAGNLVSQTTSQTAGTTTTVQGVVMYFYDRLGHKIAQIDQEGYLTSYTLDANGNVLKEERFATKLTGPFSVTSDPAVLRASVAGNAADRITAFTYDRNGNRLTESRQSVNYWTVATNGALTSVNGNSTVTYAYNALGEVSSKTEATGDATTYLYDAYGRQTSATSASFSLYDGSTNSDTTSFYYDGLNNLVESKENGARATHYTYVTGGQLTQMTDANNNITAYSYDADGRTILRSYTRQKSDGTSVTEENVTGYDLLGRVSYQTVATKSGSSWVLGDQTILQYDAFGELASRSIKGAGQSTTVVQETFAYDDAGRVYRSTAGDGTVKFFLYDANGKQTMEVTSDGNTLASGLNWSSMTLANVLNQLGLSTGSNVARSSLKAPGMVVTVSANDKRGMAIATVEPQRQTGIDASGNPVAADITLSKTYNAFGEVATQSDGRGDTTSFTYNTMGKVIVETDPAVSYTDETGTAHAGVHPVIHNFYDVSGRVVGTQDANGNTNTRTLLAGTGYDGSDALVTKEFHADGDTVTNGYDKFEDLLQTTDEAGQVEKYTYDAMDNLVRVDHPTRIVGAGSGNYDTVNPIALVDAYVYDSLGRRIKHYNSELGGIETTDYDAQGRVVKTGDMAGNTITTSYAWNASLGTSGLGTFGGWVETTTNSAIDASETLDVDSFGRTIGKMDYGNITYSYTFDAAGRLQSSDHNDVHGRDANRSFTYYNTGLMATDTSVSYFYDTDYPSYNFDGWSRNTYAQRYQYDVDGNRTRETYTAFQHTEGYNVDDNEQDIGPLIVTDSTPYVAVDETATWDAGNRMLSFQETTGYPTIINWAYDLNGNIRHMAAQYESESQNGAGGGSATTQDYWYKYDSMNRFVLTKGTLSGGSIVTGSTGSQITYSGGRRATMSDASGGTETYVYSTDGYLAQVKIGGVVRAAYYYDQMGRVIHYYEYDTAGPTSTTDYSAGSVYGRQATYDDLSEVTSDTVTTTLSNGTSLVVTTNYQYTGGQLTDALQVSSTRNGVAQTRTHTEYNYQWYDGPQLFQEVYYADATSGSYNTSAYTYDTNNHLVHADLIDADPGALNLSVDNNGEILTRSFVRAGVTAQEYEQHYYFDGIAVGDIGNNGTSDVDYAQSIAAHRTPSQGGLFQGGATTGTPSADFDRSYDAINGLTYSNGPSSYTVQAGDTLTSIALSVYGDASQWYLLADANGLSGDEVLQAGTVLSVPNKISNFHNNSSTYRVYDPNQIIGDTTPNAVAPPSKHGGCGAFGQILLAVIAVAVAVATYGAASEFAVGTLGLESGSVGAAVVGGALAGAAGSVASQTVGVATGLQKSFNWGAVGLAAIGGGVGAGLGVDGLDLFDGATDSAVIDDALRGITGSLVSQGIGLATGLQSKFDWAGVAAAGVGAAVGAGLSDILPDGAVGTPGTGSYTPASWGNGIVSGMAADIATAATRTLINGSDFGDNIIAALPDTIGRTIGGYIADRINSPDLAPAETDNGDNLGVGSGRTPFDRNRYLVEPSESVTVTAARTPWLEEQAWRAYYGITGVVDEIGSLVNNAIRYTSESYQRETEANVLAPQVTAAIFKKGVYAVAQWMAHPITGSDGNIISIPLINPETGIPVNVDGVTLTHPLTREDLVNIPLTIASVAAPAASFLEEVPLSVSAAESGSTKFLGQGFDSTQADYLAAPYEGMGHHFVPRQAGLPSFISDSPLNVLKPSGISRGDFYELHYQVDPDFYGAAFPKAVGGSWRGSALGLEKYTGLQRLWYASPTPLKVTVGSVAAGSGVATGYYYLRDHK